MVQLRGETSNTSSSTAIIEELENWERVLKAEPEVIHKLRAFQTAADGQQPDPPISKPGARVRDRSMRGPSR